MIRVALAAWPVPWPLPALLAWALAWVVLRALLPQGHGIALACSVCLSAVLAWAGSRVAWRRLFIFGGFVLSLLLSGLAHGVTPVWWLLPALALLLLYPLRAWRDAPLYPTPIKALAGLMQATGLPAKARALDAGCGAGHGLQALQLALPQAAIEGIERSWPLRALAAWRCPKARVRQGDMWLLHWQAYDLVYLFQRPESMARAMAKAQTQMRPGAWLASLEFEVPGRQADAQLPGAEGKLVWLYRIGTDVVAQPPGRPADKSPSTPARLGPDAAPIAE